MTSLPLAVACALPSLQIPRSLEAYNVRPSAGFIMCNVGLRANRGHLGLPKFNTWWLPTGADGDMATALARYRSQGCADPDNVRRTASFVTKHP